MIAQVDDDNSGEIEFSEFLKSSWSSQVLGPGGDLESYGAPKVLKSSQTS